MREVTSGQNDESEAGHSIDLGSFLMNLTGGGGGSTEIESEVGKYENDKPVSLSSS